MKTAVALLGCGTIGTGVVSVLGKKLADSIIVKRVLVKNPEKKRDHIQQVVTTDINLILNDREIGIVVELMGGYEPARTYILGCLRAKKHVVTANKAVLSKHWDELAAAAKQNGVKLLYEGAVGGCIPVIRTIKNALAADEIRAVYGILNGTTNYILTSMTKQGDSFDRALKKAQELGFAEPDPSFDINGTDVAHKTALLATAAFGANITPGQVYTEGIAGLSIDDLKYAREWGYVVKLLGIARHDGSLDVRVHPVLVPKDHPLSGVDFEYNAVYIESELCGGQMLLGKGAGPLPTASAVVSNIIDILHGSDQPAKSLRRIHMKEIEKLSMEYYVRLQARDQVGVLSRISGIMAKHNISIAQAVQVGRQDTVPIVIRTHSSMEKDIQDAISQIEGLDVVCAKPVILRVLD
ncbi:MAG: homoserine dehydrogenase [archaeon]